MTGHCRLRVCLFTMQVVSSLTCRFCDDENHVRTSRTLTNVRKKRLSVYRMLGSVVIMVNGLLTGHCRLRVCLFTMLVASSPTCRFCDNENDVWNSKTLTHVRKKRLSANRMLGRELRLLAICLVAAGNVLSQRTCERLC